MVTPVAQRVVITGANRGLGLALAQAYATRGDEVWAGCRTPEAADDLKAITSNVYALDTGSAESITTFARALDGRAVDVIVNNAGVDGRSFGAPDSGRDVLALDVANIESQMRVNAIGPMLLVRELLPALGRGSRVVNLSSQIGSMEVSAGMGRDVGYAVSKAALNMITVKLAWRLHDDGIIAVAIHPGYLRTDMGGPTAPMGAAESAAALVSLIATLTLEQSGSFVRWDGTVHPW
jgi:NAD(P)-dependent dehydrogenase (short-subunit alcohol dehydrogenase family)